MCIATGQNLILPCMVQVACLERQKKSVTVLPVHFAIILYLSIDILQSQKFNVKNLMIN